MKKIFTILVSLMVVAALLVPSVAYAKQNGQCGNGNKYAIVVGISNYPGPGTVLTGGLDLFYAANDAYAFENMLIEHGFNPNNISVLVNSMATKEAILEQIKDVSKEAKRGDEVVFYFSGHDVIPDCPPTDPVYGLWPANSPNGSDVGMLVWSDNYKQTDVVFDTELETAFSNFKTNNIVFGFDSCWAGRFDDSVAGTGRIVVMASGSDPEDIAAEYGWAYASLGLGPLPGIGWINHGLFTYFFAIQGLTYGLAPDTNGDGVVSVEEAFNYTYVILDNLTIQLKQQHPELGINEIPVMDDQSLSGDVHL